MVSMKKLIATLAGLGLVAGLGLSLPANAADDFTITELSVFDAGSGDGGAEIASYHKATSRSTSPMVLTTRLTLSQSQTQRTLSW